MESMLVCWIRGKAKLKLGCGLEPTTCFFSAKMSEKKLVQGIRKNPVGRPNCQVGGLSRRRIGLPANTAAVTGRNDVR